ncbi:DUF3783 domain-containing protein [Ileibacterium valens]|uniref:DUF3783 domain-containing protein n=1 Tax=Ileibacterium valens TaxID=1862668 RepID=A0A1U7ND21_9FIRM|nr:DUF3783 domain-containing protein [Ileibacterium valens]OLU36735.1 hypothetical protein BO222_11860 [Ileibacterium valens]OLU39007.1 hypothetical protein BM735_08330 [Erysipelotrichaceae bacterium NYU-BL-F16]OLU41228.1 hypothetical protein BO224_03940 [Erysipelotrichaceae bacterium NYU-BL-E8]
MILIYEGSHFRDPKERKKIESLFKDQKIRWISESMLDHTIDELLKAPDDQVTESPVQNAVASSLSKKVYPNKKHGNPALIYVTDMPRERLEKIPDLLDKNGFDDLFIAVQTPANQSWTLKELLDEMKKEQAYFDKRKVLESLIQAANPERMKTEPKYAEAVMTCWNMLRQPEFPERLLDMAIEMLDAANRDI